VKATIFVDRSPGNCPQYVRLVELDFQALPNPGETFQLGDEEYPRGVKERKWRVTQEGMEIELYLGQQIKGRGPGVRFA